MDERVRTPKEMVTGVIDDPDRVGAVLDALTAAGFDEEEAVRAAGGEEALSRVDPDGSRHGVRGRVTRSLEHFGAEGGEHLAAAAEIEAGHILLTVRVSDESQRDLAVETLRAQGAHRLRYWGRWGIEDLT